MGINRTEHGFFPLFLFFIKTEEHIASSYMCFLEAQKRWEISGICQGIRFSFLPLPTIARPRSPRFSPKGFPFSFFLLPYPSLYSSFSCFFPPQRLNWKQEQRNKPSQVIRCVLQMTRIKPQAQIDVFGVFFLNANGRTNGHTDGQTDGQTLS